MTMIPIGPIEHHTERVIVCYKYWKCLEEWSELTQQRNRADELRTVHYKLRNGIIHRLTYSFDGMYTSSNVRHVLETTYSICNITHAKGVHDVAGLAADRIIWVDEAPTRTQMDYLNSRIRHYI